MAVTIYGPDNEVNTYHVGQVLYTREMNLAQDSYWYAGCWDEEKQKVVEIMYETTAAGGFGRAEVDVSDDVLLQVYRHYKNESREFFDGTANEADARRVRVGDSVTVVRGRKIPKGTIGKVFWVGTRYNRFSQHHEERAGIEVDGVRQFLPYEYLEANCWADRMLHGKERKQRIRYMTLNCIPATLRYRFDRRFYQIGGKNERDSV